MIRILAVFVVLLGAMTGEVATIPVRLDGLVMATVGTVRGRPILFDVDTGATHTIIDSTIAKQLQLRAGKQSMRGAGSGSVAATSLAPFDIKLADVSFRARDPLAIDLSNVGSAIREGGLLGYDFFERYVVAFDYDHKTISLFDPTHYVHRGSGTAVSLILKPPRAYVMVTLSTVGVTKRQQLLRVDTGSSDAADSDIILRSAGPKKDITSGVGIGSRFHAYLGTLSELDLGSYKLTNIPSATGGVQLIGDSVWSRFNLVVDFVHRKLYLSPRATRGKSDAGLA